jgi:hypothetical protein
MIVRNVNKWTMFLLVTRPRTLLPPGETIAISEAEIEADPELREELEIVIRAGLLAVEDSAEPIRH